MKLTRVIETCLYVDDLERAAQFYGDARIGGDLLGRVLGSASCVDLHNAEFVVILGYDSAAGP